MDLYKQINKVVTLNDYIELTEDVNNKQKDVNIALNMSTILCLKKIRSLEIEYFNKCDGSGAAFRLFERMLSIPASKTWGLLGSEVIGMIQYWLDAVRKHLIYHHFRWWMFLRQILSFIKELRQKDYSLSSRLVEECAESMLDLATSGKPDIHQRYEILHTFNLFCAEASREIRLALKSQFEPYFIRLATILATCGHLPTQLAALEALLRWLQPRHDPATRRDAAGRWLLPHLYPRTAVDVFLSRSWMNFYQDARDFLNCHNTTQEMITSVICRKLSVGRAVIVSGKERRQCWLDINTGSDSVTVMLEPQLLEALGMDNVSSCETLTVGRDSAQLVKLHRESNQVTISIVTISPPLVIPSRAALFPHPSDVTVVLSSRADMPRVDRALRNVFDDKYQRLLDVDNLALSPLQSEGVQRKISMDENTRFSAAIPERPRRVGAAVRSRRLRSFSSTSTGSLAQLHDKLTNLPYYEFTKEPVGVCAKPDLSVVSELSETGSWDSNRTLKLHRCAVPNRDHVEHNKSKSDTETTASKILEESGSQSDKYVRKTKINEGNISSLFCATIGSADDVISATVERLPKGVEVNTDNLMELLVREALESKANEGKERQSDSGINTENGKSQEQIILDSETIEDTQYTELTTGTRNPAGLRNIKAKAPNNNIVSKPTSDNSNTESISKTRDVEAKTPNKNIDSKSTANESNTKAINSTRNINARTRNKNKSTSDESNTSTINETRNIKIKTPNKKIVSKSTSDDSNEPQLSFVNVRKRNQRQKSVKKKETETSDETSFGNKEIEDFFSQHFAEKEMGDIIISPTLAKKINESSSSSSNEFLLLKDVDENFDIRNEELLDLDIVECLNDMVDKVSSDFDKCTEYLEKGGADSEILMNMAKNMKTKENISKDEKGTSTDDTKEKESKKPLKNTKSKCKQTIKLKFPPKKQKSQPKAKGKLQLEPVSKMSTIIEVNSESDANKTAISDTKETTTDKQINEEQVKTPIAAKNSIDNTNITPLVRNKSAKRKRKLYSPKDDEIRFDTADIKETSNKPDKIPSDSESDIVLAVLKTGKISPKPSTSCYKEIENERKKYRRIRAQKSMNKELPPSPKTKRLNDVFENLKNKFEVHENEKIIMVDKKSDMDIAIYNFTSDSEDEDFKRKKIKVQKRTSTTTIGSSTSIMSTRRRRDKNKPTKLKDYLDEDKDSVNETKKLAKRKRAPRRKVSKVKVLNSPELKVDRPTDLVDEKMREAPPEELNTSFVAAAVDNNVKEPEPLINPPEIEVISDENANVDVADCKEKTIQQKIPEKQKQHSKSASKKETKNAKNQNQKKPTKVTKNVAKTQEVGTKIVDFTKDDDDKTVSPLPGLVIESEIRRNNVDDSITTNVVQKLQKLYKEGPDVLNDTTTTQNMLSENERPNSSPRMNITDEMGKIFGEDVSTTSKKCKTSCIENKENSEVIDDTINSDQMSKISKEQNSKSKPSRLRLKRNNQPESAAKEDNNARIIKIKIERLQITESQKSKPKSQIDDINYDEIICVDTVTDTGFKIDKSRPKEAEIVNIADYSEVNSERSIATDGITGHGDINECPPSPKLLGEIMIPRELEDMDSASRAYYIELSRKVNNSKGSSEGRKTIDDEKYKTKASQRVEKGSDSDTDQKSDKGHKFEVDEYAKVEMLPSRRDTESESSFHTSRKTPTVSITRLSSKELSKWLPSSKSTPKSSFECNQKKETLRGSIRTAKNITSKETTLESTFETPGISSKELSKWLPSSKTTPKSSFECNQKKETLRGSIRTAKNITSKETTLESTFETPGKLRETPETSTKLTRNRKSPISNYIFSKKTQETPESTPKKAKNRKSQISPINLDNLLPKRKIVPKVCNVSSSEDETVETQDVEIESKLESIAKKHFLRPSHESSHISKAPSEYSSSRISKRKSPIPKVIEAKRRKLYHSSRSETIDEVNMRKLDKELRVEVVDISTSRQSSNVEDWVNNILSTPKANYFDASDVLQNLMEKLNTTLVEIHQSTSKDFISLFVEARKELGAMKEARRQMFTQMVEHHQQMEERESGFMSWLGSRAAELLRRDCSHKRAMVALLQEDVEAVRDHLANQGEG